MSVPVPENRWDQTRLCYLRFKLKCHHANIDIFDLFCDYVKTAYKKQVAEGKRKPRISGQTIAMMIFSDGWVSISSKLVPFFTTEFLEKYPNAVPEGFIKTSRPRSLDKPPLEPKQVKASKKLTPAEALYIKTKMADVWYTEVELDEAVGDIPLRNEPYDEEEENE